MLDDLTKLSKVDDDKSISLEQSVKFSNTKKKIKSICRALTLDTRTYKPQVTANNIDSYLKSESNKLERILYSEISNYVFSLEMSKRGTFATNIEKLLLYSLNDKNSVSEDTRKVIIKIYDHVQLALHQIENANNIFANSIEEAKENLNNQIKGVEKEYISILGIFASIVLAFVGGITFSTSVLQNISDVSIFRLLLIVDFLAFTLINVIYILVRFIFAITDKNTKLFSIRSVNTACLIIAAVVALGWLVSVNKLPEYVLTFLPWSK